MVRGAGARAIEAGAELTIAPIGSVPADLRTPPIVTGLSVSERLDPAGIRHAREDLAQQVSARIDALV
jgi:hypothetical protein